MTGAAPGGVAPLVAVLGRGLVPADEPVLTADDWGVTRGDGCFDSTRVVTDDSGQARAEHLIDHLDRLAASAAALDIDAPTHDEWVGLVQELLAALAHPREAVLKLVLTRGREWLPGRPHGVRLDRAPRPGGPTPGSPGRRTRSPPGAGSRWSRSARATPATPSPAPPGCSAG
ncbi:MAG: hypothetical protein M9891_13480 [Austwickia sp.]|nr:hypothetical protein [Austwickia sp.]